MGQRVPKNNLIEAVMGAVVLLVAGFFLVFAYSNSHLTVSEGYTLKARFDRVDGLVVGSDVRLSGIKVGEITRLALDPKTYTAIVSFQVTEDVRLPTDSVAEIIGNGLMGNKFLALVPGGEEQFIASGGEIKYTQSSVSLESLIGQFIFSAKNKEGPVASPDSGAPKGP